jgi:hypothetical protein
MTREYEGPGLSSVKEKPEKLGKEQGKMKESGHI